MLRLEGLTLSGFKSFADRTELVIPDGVTCVVGPNGCGKSNVVDSVAWVLGEQSPRILRGSRMEDVIFAGSRSRKPAGMAEVNLHFSPKSKPVAADLPPAEVADLDEDVDPRLKQPLVVTRRLYRNGDSEYLVNGERSRLRDITGLLMGTGMGTRLYSIIEQGRVEQILNSKPLDRRGLIEEAAGITRYKARRKAARLKLDESQQSLLRVTDIIGELEKQIRSLKRQAGTARRYRRLSARRRIVLRALHAARHERLSTRLAAVETELAGLMADEAQSRKRLARLEEDAGGARDQVATAEAERDSAARECHALQLELERLRQVVSAATERLGDVEARTGRALSLEKALDAELAQGKATAEAARALLGGLEADLGSRRGELEAGVATAQDTRQRLAGTHASISELKEDIFEVMSESAGLRNRKVEVESTRQRLQTQADRIGEAVTEADADLARTTTELERAQEQLRRALASEEELHARAKTLATQAEELAASAVKLRAQHADAQRLRDEAAWQLEAVRETLRTRAAFSQGVRDFLAGQPEGSLGTVAELVTAQSGDELACEKGLGSLLQAVAFASRESAEVAARQLAGERSAEVFLAFPGSTRDGLAAQAQPLPAGDGIVGPLSAALSFPPHLTWLAEIVPQAWIVETADDAIALARLHSESTFVSRDGVLVGPGGQGSGGRPRGEGEGLLEAKSREARLSEDEARLAADAKARATELAGVEAARATLAAEREELHSAVSAAEVEALSRRHAVASQRQLADAARARHASLTLQAEAISSELQAAIARLADADEGLAKCAAAQVALTQSLAAAHASAESLEGDAASMEAEVTRLREAVTVASERQVAARAELARADQDLAARTARRDEAARDAAALASQRQETLKLIARSRDEIRERSQRAEELGAALSLVEEHVRTVRAAVLEGGDRLRALRAEHDGRARLASEAGLRRERLAADLEHLASDCRRELGVGPTELPLPVAPGLVEEALAAEAAEVASAAGAEAVQVGVVAEMTGDASAATVAEIDGLDSVAADAADAESDEAQDRPVSEELPWQDGVLDIEALAEEAETLRARLDRIGPVNLVAIDEYDEIAERHGFLVTERDDLLQSIASLETTISEIDVLSRERFVQAFEAVRKTFDEAFQSLFRGGHAELRLQDESDPLECGIEIIAQPPGKRLQNMMLLSGGEKALTAIALLFALFRYRPSPFCILDEVDAPLDESNVVRFIELVTELAKDTQFIVVTHNRRSMERGKVLYGVTMEEPGCSKLVSVRVGALGESAA